MDSLKTAVDSFTNFVANLGTSRDKQSAGTYTLTTLTDDQLSTIYRTSWMARKAVDIPANDATRKWREWQADEEQISRLEAEESRLLLPQKVRKVLQLARLYRGAALYFSIDGDDPETPFDPAAVGPGALDFITVFSRQTLTAGDIEQDPMEKGYGLPKWYEVSGGYGTQRIHPSRLAIFIGSENLVTEGTGYVDGWGDSVLQSAYEAVRNADATASNTASLVYEARVDVLQIPNLTEIMGTPKFREALENRVVLTAQLKGNNGMMVLDKEEDYSQKSYTFAGLTDINYQALQAVSGAVDIPLTRFLGQAPAGLSSTGESDLKNYYDAVSGIQELVMTPALENLDEALIRSALGDHPDDVDYTWSSLWQMSDEQKSQISKQTAETIKILAESGLFGEDQLGEAAANLLVQHSILPSFEYAEPEFPDEDEL